MNIGLALLRALFCFGLLLAIAAPFGSSVAPRPVDPALGRPVPAPGATIRVRGEGWADTHYGEHGLLREDLEAAADRGDAARVVGVWGDSFVEAGQVDDSIKFTSQLRRLALADGDSTLTAFAIGQPDRDVSDVVDLVPRYERLLDFDAQVLILHDLFDLSPNATTFLAQPELHFVPRRFAAPAPALRAKLSTLHLDFLWPSLHRVFVAHRNPIGGEPLRWRPGPVPSKSTNWPSWRELSTVDPGAWAYALDRLQSSTEKEWTILFVPRVPFLDHGSIALEHPAKPYVATFAGLCAARGIDFVDLSEDLAREYVEHGRSAFGFANARVGRGHLNAAGHRLLARALYDRFGER